MADPVKHAATITADSNGIYLECSCGQELARYTDPIVAPYSEVNAKVLSHALVVMGQALSAALAPILNPPKQRDFKLVPPSITPQLPPLRLAPPEKED